MEEYNQENKKRDVVTIKINRVEYELLNEIASSLRTKIYTKKQTLEYLIRLFDDLDKKVHGGLESLISNDEIGYISLDNRKESFVTIKNPYSKTIVGVDDNVLILNISK